jgi:uncharacterized membrane protein YhaH (DUF805 family)
VEVGNFKIISKMKSIINVFRDTFNFKGLTNRKEYWTYVISFYVFGLLLSIILGLIEGRYLRVNNLQPDGLMFQDFKFYLKLILLIPMISATTRRLRDAGFSTWFTIIPILNFILCLKPTKRNY